MIGLERVINMDSLYRSWQKIAAKNACGGVDGIDLSFYRSDLRKNLRSLQTAVSTGSYRPYAEKVYVNHKGRQISVSCVDDKIIQTALSHCLISAYTPAKCAYGFIPKRSIFSAKKSLDAALSEGVCDYAKADIRHFYESIDGKILMRKVERLVPDTQFLSLLELLINVHKPGISTGSCLSPTLSNIFLADFDREIEAASVFFARYVDDMLIAPAANMNLIREKLAEVGLEINEDKSMSVNAAAGFRFLGFDIKYDVRRRLDDAIENGDFVLAEALYETQISDIVSDAPSPAEETQAAQVTAAAARPEYELPPTVHNVVRKCHIVRGLVEKAKIEKHLDFGEKTSLLQIFHCLDDDGAKFIHYVLGFCDDYDYAETQRRINKYSVDNPLGCKKLREHIGGHEVCSCSFTDEKVYPTPIIHALRVDRECWKPSGPKDSIGHFKAKNPKDKATDALGYLIELNKKQYEIAQQQEILKGQIEDLFERTNTRELQTPQGLLIKTDEGLFIKVG